MHSSEYNLALLNEMLAEFEAFIHSQELFWPLQKKSFGGVYFPQLSLGALLLTLDELDASKQLMNPRQEQEFSIHFAVFERALGKWRVAIEQKASREMITRTNLWNAYLQDIQEDPDAKEDYVREVRNRVLITKLKRLGSYESLEGVEPEISHALDKQMALDAQPADFLWDEKLKPIYPIKKFPFLYSKPR